MRFSSFLAESHGADCPSKKLWKDRKHKTEREEGGDEMWCHVWALLNDNQTKEHSIPLSAQKKKGNIGNKKEDTEREIFTSLLDMRHREDGGSRGAVSNSRAIRAEAAGVVLKPLPLRRSAGRSHRSGCLSVCLVWRTQSARCGEKKIKPAHRLQIKTSPLRLPSWNIYHLSLGRFPFWWHTRHN